MNVWIALLQQDFFIKPVDKVGSTTTSFHIDFGSQIEVKL